jgi:N-acyl amino acid synthase of PEP-CTERM/exosortase system
VQDEVFRLRHQIFCEEFQLFETREDGMETDDFDRHSLFLLLRSARTGEAVGCVRVVTTDPESPSSLLPFEKACGSMLERIVLDPGKLPRNSIGEVSRLGVAAKFRRRKGEQRVPAPLADDALHLDPVAPNPRQFPYILVSLYLGSIALAEYSSINTLFTFTELRLVTHFAKLGVPIKPINNPIDHKGVRLPCVLDVHETIESFNPFVRGVYNEIKRQIVGQRQRGATADEMSTGKNL